MRRSRCLQQQASRWTSAAFRFRSSGLALVAAQGGLTISPLRSRHEQSKRWYNTPPPLRYHDRQDVDTSDSTIYALSTAPGRAAIAVIRISGPSALQVYTSLCPSTPLPRPRYASVHTLYEPHQQPSPFTVLDSSALILYFPGPNSATGEDILELHVHGGPAIVRSVLRAVSRCGHDGKSTIRPAEPGEFTRRSFFNDRLSLPQIEALSDALSAETEQQRRLSVRGTAGGLSRQYDTWRGILLEARGELEALIDFSEDQHFDEPPSLLLGNVAARVGELRRALAVHSANASRGELLRSGIGVALLGAPNAGKSSLLNRIVGREAAIVSGLAGTTRDVVEVGMDVGGYLCRFADTAGLRRAIYEAGKSMGRDNEGGQRDGNEIGEVEIEGMKRARARALDSDLVIVVLSFECGLDGQYTLLLDEEVTSTAEDMLQQGRSVLIVVNKNDRQPSDVTEVAVKDEIRKSIPSMNESSIRFLSCTAPETVDKDNDGISGFMDALLQTFASMTSAITGAPAESGTTDSSIWQESLGATERQRVLLDECTTHLDAFLAMARAPGGADDQASGGPELSAGGSGGYGGARLGEYGTGEDVDFVLAAEYLRGAAQCLAKITGRGEGGDVEEVLGVVFEKFCVGK